jgi:hypothetical protein
MLKRIEARDFFLVEASPVNLNASPATETRALLQADSPPRKRATPEDLFISHQTHLRG